MKIVLLTYVNRSGSTYLANLLSSSKEVCACPEGDALLHLFLEDPGRSFSLDAQTKKKIKRAFIKDRKMSSWCIEGEDYSFLEHARTNIEAFAGILKFYVDQSKPGADTVVFKSERIAALMIRINKASSVDQISVKFISLVRDPRAIIASQLKTIVPGGNQLMTSNPTRTALRWSRNIKYLLRYNALFKNQVIVQFEDMILCKQTYVQQIFSLLDLDASKLKPELGDLLKNLSGDDKAIHRLASQAPRKSRIDSWKKDLGRMDVYLIDHTCSKYMKEFGYPVINKNAILHYEVLRLYQVLRYHFRVLIRKTYFHLSIRKDY